MPLTKADYIFLLQVSIKLLLWLGYYKIKISWSRLILWISMFHKEQVLIWRKGVWIQQIWKRFTRKWWKTYLKYPSLLKWCPSILKKSVFSLETHSIFLQRKIFSVNKRMVVNCQRELTESMKNQKIIWMTKPWNTTNSMPEFVLKTSWQQHWAV